MSVRIACVVEGHGEVQAVPTLIRRIAESFDPSMSVQIPHPIRIPRDRLIKSQELERAVDLAARTIRGSGAILILLDSDDAPPCQLGPELLGRARIARGDTPIGVVLAKREFEAWFLASAESLRGVQGLPLDLEPPPDPEAIRGAKEWLSDRMQEGNPYSPTLDQQVLTDHLDIDLARRAGSFDKCYRDVIRLLTELQNRAT